MEYTRISNGAGMGHVSVGGRFTPGAVPIHLERDKATLSRAVKITVLTVQETG
jgi:hypothetical protein